MASVWKRWREENRLSVRGGMEPRPRRRCGVHGEPGYICQLKPGHSGPRTAKVKRVRKSWLRMNEDDLIEFGRQLHAADDIAEKAKGKHDR